MTISKVDSSSHGLVNCGWPGFSDFQSNLRFGSKPLADTVENLRKKAHFRAFSLLHFADCQAPIHKYSSIAQ